jgi:RNA polymerase sigma factor (sigma-70 family)
VRQPRLALSRKRLAFVTCVSHPRLACSARPCLLLSITMADDQSFDLAGCLDRVRQRDQVAARELVEHLHPLVIRIVRAHLPRRVAEEDLSQEIFMKMFTRMGQYQGAVPFSHWVSRIAVTTCIDHLRAQKRRPEFRWADLSENEAKVLDAVMTDDKAVGAGEAMAAHELVHKLVDQLKPDDRLVIQLLDLEQKTIAEISALTGWNASLVKVRAFRARRKLQKLFEELKRKERS